MGYSPAAVPWMRNDWSTQPIVATAMSDGSQADRVGANETPRLLESVRCRVTRVIFLDFDGVLHPPKAIEGAVPPLSPARIRSGWPSTFEHLPLLASVLEGHLNVGVVVSSSWRMFLDDAELGELLAPIERWYAGSVGQPYRGRLEAIEAWLGCNQIDDYIALDDNAKFFPGTWPALIVCDPQAGLTTPGVMEAVMSWLAQPRELSSL